MEISLNRATLAEQVTQLLRESILNNEFAAGERLVESDLADQLSVSRTPVREALKSLEAAGLVKRLANGHVVTAERSLEDMIEAFHLRIALETYAVRLATAAITEAQLGALEQMCDEYDALDDDDGDRMMQLGEEFHNAIVEISGNRHIVRHVRDIYEYTSIYRERLFHSPRKIQTNTITHRDILEAMRDRDGRRSQQLMEEHLMYAFNILKTLWDTD